MLFFSSWVFLALWAAAFSPCFYQTGDWGPAISLLLSTAPCFSPAPCDFCPPFLFTVFKHLPTPAPTWVPLLCLVPASLSSHHCLPCPHPPWTSHPPFCFSLGRCFLSSTLPRCCAPFSFWASPSALRAGVPEKGCCALSSVGGGSAEAEDPGQSQGAEGLLSGRQCGHAGWTERERCWWADDLFETAAWDSAILEGHINGPVEVKIRVSML